MNKIPISDYNLALTLLGGQAFNFDYEDGFFFGFTQDKIIKLKTQEMPHGVSLYWQTYPENDDFKFLETYLRLKVDYAIILKTIQKDKYIKSAIKKFPNIRLLKQDFEQTLLSFLISPNNNIKSIRKTIRLMSHMFGKKINIDSKEYFLFPQTEVLARADLSDLLKCKLGFRAKFLKGAANFLIGTKLFQKITNLPENKARNALKSIKGVGDKISDCILAFSLGFDNVTPLDVWAKRVLTDFYKINPKQKYEEMRIWIDKYFEGYAAWAGQFLYEYIRSL